MSAGPALTGSSAGR